MALRTFSLAASLLASAGNALGSTCEGGQTDTYSLMQQPLLGPAESESQQLSPGTPVEDHWGCHQVTKQDASDLPLSSHVAILIPFREQDPVNKSRRRELDALLANLTENGRRAADEGVHWHFVIAEQSEKGPFNRGALLNVGFQRARAFFGDDTPFTAVTQDCDFIPGDDMVQFYSRSGDGPLHLANYAYCPGFGGVTIFRSDQYTSMNGYSNEMWGWGGEDDDAMDRWMSHPSHVVVAPLGHERFKDIGRSMDRRRDRRHYDKSMTVWNQDIQKQLWVSQGLSDLRYQTVEEVQEGDALVEHVIVELENEGL